MALALALVGRAQTMGFLPAREDARVELNRDFLEELARLLRRQGVAAIPTARLLGATRAEPTDDLEIARALRETIDAMDSSPNPDGEWEPARDVLGDELLARLVRVSSSSLRRYATRERRTPGEVAWRLHVVARLLASLVGSYNDYGVRRWFDRPRSGLAGATPAEVLERAETEEDDQLQHTLALAEGLTGALGAT